MEEGEGGVYLGKEEGSRKARRMSLRMVGGGSASASESQGCSPSMETGGKSAFHQSAISPQVCVLQHVQVMLGIFCK